MFNFTDSQILTTTVSNICLACLFDGTTLSTSGTVWTAFGQPIPTGQNVALVVNSNGTLLITLPPGSIGDVPFSCQSNGIVFNITVRCEFHVYLNYFVHTLKSLYYNSHGKSHCNSKPNTNNSIRSVCMHYLIISIIVISTVYVILIRNCWSISNATTITW